jgi:hypothetical protein
MNTNRVKYYQLRWLGLLSSESKAVAKLICGSPLMPYPGHIERRRT